MREIKFRVWDKLTKRMHICGEKESTLNKVTDKLKEVVEELKMDGYDYYSNEIQETLNIIEGEKK